MFRELVYPCQEMSSLYRRLPLRRRDKVSATGLPLEKRAIRRMKKSINKAGWIYQLKRERNPSLMNSCWIISAFCSLESFCAIALNHFIFNALLKLIDDGFCAMITLNFDFSHKWLSVKILWIHEFEGNLKDLGNHLSSLFFFGLCECSMLLWQCMVTLWQFCNQ